MDLVIEGLAAFLLLTFRLSLFRLLSYTINSVGSNRLKKISGSSVLLRREHGQRAQSHASRLTESRQVIQNISTFNVNVLMKIHSQ